MKKLLILSENFIDTLSRRERLLVLLGIVSVLYMLWDTFLLGPIQSSHKKLTMERLTVQKQLSDLEVRNILASALLKNKNNDKFNQQIAQKKIQLEKMDQIIKQRLQDRVPAELMAGMLNDVLQKKQGLTLIQIYNLPAEPLVKKEKTKDNTNTKKVLKTEKNINHLGIFMHPLELELEGTYLEILDYLVELEKLPWKIFWDKVELHVLEYPKVKVIIKVHTFGLKEGWLSV